MVSTPNLQAQLSYELAVYREQINMLRRETERVSLTTIDLTNALATVESLSEEQALVPIGGGVLINAALTNTSVLMPIGAGYLVNMKKETASLELNRRIDATKRAVEKLTDEFNKINHKLKEVASQLESIQSQTKITKQAEENTREDYV